MKKESLIFSIFLIGIAIASLVDLIKDALAGSTPGHLFVEGVIVIAALAGFLFILRQLYLSRQDNRQLIQDKAKLASDLEAYKKEASPSLKTLGHVIEAQLDRWHLSTAEKEIAWLMLKGFSFKEIAHMRSTSERTVREQAQGVYKKSGVEGRTQFSAFFLEDLMSGEL